MTAQINEMHFKKQEEVKLSVEGVEAGDAFISPIDNMLASLFGAKIETIEPGIFDYNIAISVKKDKKGINQLTVSVKASEPDIPDSGQLNLFGGVENVERSNQKKIDEFFNKMDAKMDAKKEDTKIDISMVTDSGVETATTTISELSKAAKNIDSDLEVRNRKAKTKYSKMQL